MKLIVFHCKLNNNGRGSWIVAKEETDRTFLGIAECLDQHTATIIKEALEIKANRTLLKSSMESVGGPGCDDPFPGEK